MNTQEIIKRLAEIHAEIMPETISDASFDAAWENGYRDPCGCELCQLMNELAGTAA